MNQCVGFTFKLNPTELQTLQIKQLGTEFSPLSTVSLIQISQVTQ